MVARSNSSFILDAKLEDAVGLIRRNSWKTDDLPTDFPEMGLGELETLELLAPYVIGRAARLDSAEAFANMDPPTPWITWVMALWNARLNQNLLHPSTAPFAKDAERRVLHWLSPLFGMQGGHMCSGSTLANLTALWVARESGNVQRIVASESSHLSIRKSAQLLQVPYDEVPATTFGQLDVSKLDNLADACLVLNAGTTATGGIDQLELAGQANWTHIDAAWGGPLRFSSTHSYKLAGIEKANSVAMSSHKLLMQPKDSALVMFRDIDRSNSVISFSSGYLAEPNIGIQGSRGAAANLLLGTLLTFGRVGIEEMIDHLMGMADSLAERLRACQTIELLCMPTTGVVVFRPRSKHTQDLYQKLPEGMVSKCVVYGEDWLRAVAANPLANINLIADNIESAASEKNR